MDYLAAMAGLTNPSGIGLKLAAVLRPDVVAGLIFGIVAALPAVKFCRQKVPFQAAVQWLPRTAIPILLMMCLVRLAAGTYNPFIYFRF